MHGPCGPHWTCRPATHAVAPAGFVDGSALDPGAVQTPPEGVSPRDWSVLRQLGIGEGAQVGFQGIKRRLDLHPEALRRSLDRLRRDGLVEKDSMGYRLTDAGTRLAGSEAQASIQYRPMPLAFLLTPSHVTPETVVPALAQRWFDGLHWYGISEGSSGTTLTWLTDGDDQPVRVRVARHGIGIDAALGNGSPDDRLHAAAPLLAAIAAILRAPTPPVGDGDTFRSFQQGTAA